MDNLAYLRSEETRIRNRISTTKREIREINNKITRLEKVYDELKPIKDSIETEKKKAKYKTFLSGDKDNWKGDKGLLFEDAIKDGVEEDYKQYYKKVDDVHDDLLDEIIALKNKKSRKQSILGSLEGVLRSILGEIEKIFN